MNLDDHLRPETRALIERVETALPSQKTSEFTRLKETMLHIQVCTSLSDEETAERANLLPPGESLQWVLSTDPAVAPVPCADNPATHRHLIFEC